jgi:predicted RNase H-like HicB family nuclease
MRITYPACFYKFKDQYTVLFPDLNHLVDSGTTLAETQKYANEILASYLSAIRSLGEAFPTPSEHLDPIKVAEDEWGELWEAEKAEDCFVSNVSTDVDEYEEKVRLRAVKRTVTLPKWLEETAKAANINFSKTLQKALANELGVSL